MARDVVEPQRVDVVQWLEVSLRIPPSVGEGFEFGDFGTVDVF